jgi:hypothetical protein
VSNKPTDTEAMQALATLRAWLAPQTEAPRVYTSINLPPGCRTRETFNNRVRHIPEAYQDGKVWVCPVDAYEAAVRRGGRRTAPKKAEPERPKVNHRAILATLGKH